MSKEMSEIRENEQSLSKKMSELSTFLQTFRKHAAAAPYVDIEMSPVDDGPDGHLAYKDAVFISPHKMIGGPGTPGLLVARKELFQNRIPTVPGGGTVWYVNTTEHRYVEDIEHREEGGTPAIIGSIRTGLVFQLKEAVGTAAIGEREHALISRAIDAWSDSPNIEVLGNPTAERLSIVSFVVRHDARHLHQNFVVALLNDLFGIQARGGCSCAGPYGHRLLGIDMARSLEFEAAAQGCEGIKPGWVRVNFNYFIDDAVADYIIDAVRLIAEDGWRLLPHYRFDPITGLWRHRKPVAEPPLSLDDVSYATGAMEYRHRRRFHGNDQLADYLAEAERIMATASTSAPSPLGGPTVTPNFEHLRWFPLPHEILSRE
jgi:hypothetical protein